jgi:hypothetical protein
MQDKQTIDLESLDELIESGKAYEEALLQTQLRLRRFLLNAAVYRQAIEKYGEAVWRRAV